MARMRDVGGLWSHRNSRQKHLRRSTVALVLAAVLLSAVHGCTRRGSSEVVFVRHEEGLDVKMPHHSASFLYGEPIEGTYRSMGMQVQEEPFLAFVVADLWGIPLAKMPDDRPFRREDFASAEIFFLVSEDPGVRASVRGVMSENLGWKKVRFSGRVLVVDRFVSDEGEDLHFPGSFVDVQTIEAIY